MSFHELRQAIGAEWRARARCIGADTQAFFPGEGVNASDARRICQDCPVAESCLEEALRVDVEGVWGGTTRRERVALRKKLGIRAQPFPTERAPCGTEAGARRHRREGEEPCGMCREGAHAARARRAA